MDTIDQQLRAAFDAAAADLPSDSASRVQARPYRVRTTGQRVATKFGVAAALAGVGALVLTSTSGASHPGTSVARAPLSLSAQVSAAVAAQSGNIFHSHTTSPGFTPADQWISPDGNVLHVTTHTASGGLALDMTYTTSGDTQTLKQVDYSSKTWFTSTYPLAKLQTSCVQPSCFSVANGALPPGPQLGAAVVSAEGVAWMAEHGTVDKVHTKTVDGKTAYSISIASSEAAPVKPGILWVDQESNLPVQFVIDQGGQTIVEYDLDWAPATSDSTAALTAPVPAGYTQIAPDAAEVPAAK